MDIFLVIAACVVIKNILMGGTYSWVLPFFFYGVHVLKELVKINYINSVKEKKHVRDSKMENG